ncbi:putative defense protein [Ostrinia furnacalis]|uniref:putative defense protein n=1 Tax=Ostrinia furnacalis TaxID=93504 RepID=UPI00103A6AFB|nr:putative defense protein [Ostrinia furnacalis]
MLPRKRSTILLTLLVLIKSSEQYSSGAPAGACNDQMPRHASIQAQSTPPPYVIGPSSSQVRQGDSLNVTVGSPAGAPTPIGGFILQARSIQQLFYIFFLIQSNAIQIFINFYPYA